jgi:DNA-directed RNA polymerase subunit alpha
MLSDEAQTLTIKVKGVNTITAGDIKHGGQVNIMNPEQHIADITDKNTEFDVEITVERGLGFIPKEVLQKDRVDVGTITLDAIFTPIRRVNYEVENMRVGDRTDYNRLRIFIETDGTLTPREALEKCIYIMISQLKAVVGFKEEAEIVPEVTEEVTEEDSLEKKEEYDDVLKTRIETLDLSSRTINALINANIRTVGGLARKKEEDILDIEGLGNKGVQEIKKVLSKFGLTLK